MDIAAPVRGGEVRLTSSAVRGGLGMIQAATEVDRSPQEVWAYFTDHTTWESWWGGAMKSAEWKTGGKLVWALGGASEVISIEAAQRVVIRGTAMETTWSFEGTEGGGTRVSAASAPRGGAHFTDGGASYLRDLESSLQKLKTAVEAGASAGGSGQAAPSYKTVERPTLFVFISKGMSEDTGGMAAKLHEDMFGKGALPERDALVAMARRAVGRPKADVKLFYPDSWGRPATPPLTSDMAIEITMPVVFDLVRKKMVSLGFESPSNEDLRRIRPVRIDTNAMGGMDPTMFVYPVDAPGAAASGGAGCATQALLVVGVIGMAIWAMVV